MRGDPVFRGHFWPRFLDPFFDIAGGRIAALASVPNVIFGAPKVSLQVSVDDTSIFIFRVGRMLIRPALMFLHADVEVCV